MDTSLSLGEFWKILILRQEAFETVRRSESSLWFSLRLFVLAGLIASIGILSAGLPGSGQASFSDRLNLAATTLRETVAGWPQRLMPQAGDAVGALADRMEAAAAAIASVEPPLGSSTSRALRAIGDWASSPFAWLAAWLTASLPIMLAARLLGGRGSVRQQVSLILLAFLPQALTVLSSFSLTEGTTASSLALILRVGAAVWSLAILVYTLATANGFGRGQAVKVLIAAVLAVMAVGALAAWLVARFAGPLLSSLL